MLGMCTPPKSQLKVKMELVSTALFSLDASRVPGRKRLTVIYKYLCFQTAVVVKTISHLWKTTDDVL